MLDEYYSKWDYRYWIVQHIECEDKFKIKFTDPELNKNLAETYPQLRTLMSCIREFRVIFQRKNMPCLYLFIEKYKNSNLKELSRFASGLGKD